MKKGLVISSLVVAMLFVFDGQAEAAHKSRGLGVGAEAMLDGFTSAAVSYDFGPFMVDGLFGFALNSTDTLRLGGRFFFKLHSVSSADISVGGGVGIAHIDQTTNDDTQVHLEVGARIRAFVVPNVALIGGLGLGFLFKDGDDRIAFGGQIAYSLGVIYYFG